MKIRALFLTIIFMATLFLTGCSQNMPGMKNGYYTAETVSFDAYGWKEFITIYVSNNKIVTVEYNAKNTSGFIKSWDMDYMRKMNSTSHTYPNKYTRDYAILLLNRQNPDKIDAITGATHSWVIFQLLAEAVITQAKAGDKKVAFVKIPTDAEEKGQEQRDESK